MSGHTDVRWARPEAGLLARLRSSTMVVDIAVVSGVSLMLGLIRLGTPSLWYDEAYTFKQIHKGYLAQFEGYQPFYYWIQKPWTGIAGTSEWAMRFPSVVGAMLASALLVVFARELFDRRVALLSGLFLATSPFFVLWSQQARGYPFLVAASLVATLLLLGALERGSPVAWTAYGAAFAALLVTHTLVGLLLVPAHIVLITQRRERLLPHGLLGGLVIVAVGFPWVAQLAIRTSSETSEVAWIPFPTLRYAKEAILGVGGVDGLGLGIVLAALGIWMLRRAGKGTLGVWLATWAFGPLVLAILISIVRPAFQDRYLIVASPAFAMLAAVAVFGFSPLVRPYVLVVAASATAFGLVSWYQTADDGNWAGEDWRSAVAEVLARSEEAQAVVVVPWWAQDAVEYYGADASHTSTADSIWVLYRSHDGDPEISADIRRTLGFGDHVLVERRQFGWKVSAQLWKRSD